MSEESRNTPVYSADSITVLEGLEAVRVRPAMYIGDTDVRGLHHLIWEVVDNSVDEALAGHATTVQVTIQHDGSIRVGRWSRHPGRNPPDQEGIPAVEVVLTKLHAGGKFEKDSYKVSGWSARRRRVLRQRALGVARGRGAQGGQHPPDALRARWKPRPPISRSPAPRRRRARSSRSSPTIRSSRPRRSSTTSSQAPARDRLPDGDARARDRAPRRAHRSARGPLPVPEGLLTFVEHINKNKEPLHPEVIHFVRETVSNEDPEHRVRVELAMQYTDAYQESVFTFVQQHQHARGWNAPGRAQAGLTRTPQQLHQAGQARQGGPHRRPPATTSARVSPRFSLVFVPDPQFEGQTKDKLGNREVQGVVESVVGECFSTYLEENPTQAKTIVQKALRAHEAREAARKARELVRRKSALSSGAMPGQAGRLPEQGLRGVRALPGRG